MTCERQIGPYQLVNESLEKWSASYSGPKFHAVLCDPPYGLEFMGKEWDKFDVRQPDDETFHRSGVGPFDRAKVQHGTSTGYGESLKAMRGYERHVKQWGEAIMPHLYPGGLVLMFGGTRTWHRLACGMEDAGFELFDTINFCSVKEPEYQCGWFEWYTGQGFPKAQEIANGFCQCRAVSEASPVHLSGMPRTVRDAYVASQSTTQESTNVQPEVYGDAISRQDGCETAEAATFEGRIASRQMRGVQNRCVDIPQPPEAEQGCVLLTNLRGQSERSRVDATLPQGSSSMDCIEPVILSGEDDRVPESSVERRRDVLPQARKLQADQVRSLPDGASGNGQERRLRDGAPPDYGAVDRATIDASGSSASPEPRPAGQSSDESGVVARQQEPQTDGTRCPTCRKFRVPESVVARWRGYKTAALKPSHEPILCFRKPLEKTYAETALQYGSGALNVDGGRIQGPKGNGVWGTSNAGCKPTFNDSPDQHEFRSEQSPLGRYPANLILDPESAAQLDAMTGDRPAGASVSGAEPSTPSLNCYGEYGRVPFNGFGDSGGASRFYYVAKASSAERNAGLEGFEAKVKSADYRQPTGNPLVDRIHGCGKQMRNHHPTVKPIDLCRYLATLLLPPDSVKPRRLLVPFAGSGSEMIGAMLAGWDEIVGIEQDKEQGYVAIAEARLDWWKWAAEQSKLSDPMAILARYGFACEPSDSQPSLFVPEQLTLSGTE